MKKNSGKLGRLFMIYDKIIGSVTLLAKLYKSDKESSEQVKRISPVTPSYMRHSAKT